MDDTTNAPVADAPAQDDKSFLTSPVPAPETPTPPAEPAPMNRAAMDDQSMQQYQDLPDTRRTIENAKAMLYDRQGFGGKAPQALLASKTKDDPQAFRDGTAAVAGMSALLGIPAETVAENFTQYQNHIEGAMGWDHSPSVSGFANNLASHFQTQDQQHQAIQQLQAKAVTDAVSLAGKGMSPNPLVAYSDWNKTAGEAFKNVSEAQKLQIFNSVYLPVQKAMNTPEGAIAKDIVDAYGNKPMQEEVSGNIKNVATETAKRDPILNALGVTSRDGMVPDDQQEKDKLNAIVSKLTPLSYEQRQKVYQLAGALEQAQNPEQTGFLASLYSVGQAINRAADNHILFNENDPEAAQKQRVALELKEAAKSTINPLLYSNVDATTALQQGLPIISTKVAQGLGGAAPYIAANAVAPGLGMAYLHANMTADEQARQLVKNPTMTPNEALGYSQIAAIPNSLAMGINLRGLSGAVPALDNALANLPKLIRGGASIGVEGTAFVAGGVSSNIADAVIHQINPEWDKDSDLKNDLVRTLREAPVDFAMAAAFHLFHGGGQVDPQKIADLSADPANLIKQGIPAKEAEKIASLPEQQRPEAVNSALDKVTPEQRAQGVDVSVKEAEQAKEIAKDPDAPKIEQTQDGKFLLITKNGEDTHVATFDTAEGAQKGLEIALTDHQEKISASDPTNDWVTSTEEQGSGLTSFQNDSKMAADEGELLRPLDNTARGGESALALRTINASLASENKPERFAPASDQVVSQLSVEPAYQLADKLAGIFGKKIVFYTGDKLTPNGATSNALGTDRYIYLKTDGQRPHLFTLAHELWHHLERDTPELAKSLRKELAPLIKEWAKMNGKYKSYGYKPDRFFDEHVGDFLGDSFQNPDFLNNLRKRNPEAFADFATKTLEWLNDVLEKLQGWVMGGTDHIRDIEAARDMLAEGLSKYLVRDDSPIGERNSPQWWKAEPKSFGERQRFEDDPIIAYLAENPIRSRTDQEKRNKSQGLPNGGEYDGAPKLPPSHSTKIYGGNQGIDQAHQALVDEGYMPEDSTVDDLWRHIAKVSESAIKQTAAEKAEMARQRAEIKADKELADLRENDPVEYRRRLAEMEPEAQKREEAAQAIERARRINAEDWRSQNNFQRARESDQKRDEAYMAAVKSGDEAEQQRLVDEAAKEAGYTIKAHHGTSREDRVGTRFRKSRATSGPMAYFTNDREIAEKYANGKKDTSLPMPDDYRDWFKIQIPGSKKEVNIRDAWNYLSPEKKAEITKNYYTTGYSDRDAYEGPIIRDSGGSIAGKDTLDYNLREARGNTLEAAKELWLNSGQLFNNEREFLDVLKALGVDNARLDDPNATKPKVYDTYLKIQNPIVTTAIPDKVMSALRDASAQQRKPRTTYGADAWDKRTRDAKEWMAQLDSDYSKGENSMVWTSIPDWVTKTLQKFGYDGIHDTGGKMGGKGHDVFIPFDEHQIKSSDPVTFYDSGKPIPLSERFNDSRNDIRFQAARPEPIIGDIPPPKTIKEQAAEIAARVASTVRDLPKDSAFKRHLLQWSARSQQSSNEVERVQHTIETTIKDKAKRDGITNWIEAGGDRALLLQRAAASKDAKIRAGYEAAANFTPEEIKVAQKVRDTFNILEARAKKWGIDMGHRENYVPHVYLQEPQPPSGSSPKRLSEFFKFSQERTFESYFGGEQAGYHPQTKDISKLLGLYLNDMNNAINSRRLVAELSKGKASDGRPLVSPRGSGTVKKGEHGENEVHLVYPDSAQEGHEDYKVIDQPALHDWSFAGKDENGANIMVKGDLAVHPEIAQHFSNALGTSAIRKWWNTRTENPFLNLTKGTTKFLLDDLQSYVKGTMLSFSPFHQVQEGIHAIGHRINPFTGIPQIDLRKPEQADAAAHGLMLSHDRLSQSLFMEGVGSNDRNLVTMGLRKIGWGLTTAAADKVDAYQHWLFSQYIPGLKFKTYEHILERNMERFKDELAAGKVTEFQVKNLSANQANAAYGHLNYTEMGHNPTIRHAFQIALLAPDFLEARSRFVGQSLKALTGAKTGSEQLQAFAFLAVTQIVAATIQKVLTNGDPEWSHPFEMRFGNKYYGMRSVPEDVYKAFNNPTGFIGGRISPIFGRFVQEGVFGVNYRGEHTSVGDAIKDILAGTVPMPMQTLTRQWTDSGKANPISPFEQILSSAGVQVHRYSPITEMYPIAEKWVKANHPEDIRARGAYPVSKFQQLRYACEDGDAEKIQQEVARLEKGGMTPAQIAKGFKSSVNHPFTGKESHDEDMVKTLDEDDKERYHAAVERRKVILQRFNTFKNP